MGDFNAHHSSWYSSSTDTRGIMLESMVSGSNFGILNWDSPTRLPGNANPSSPDVSSASLITSTNWQTKTNLGADHLPILISLQMDVRFRIYSAQSTQVKSVISVPIKDFIHHYPRALFNDIPSVRAQFHDIPGTSQSPRYNIVPASTWNRQTGNDTVEGLKTS